MERRTTSDESSLPMRASTADRRVPRARADGRLVFPTDGEAGSEGSDNGAPEAMAEKNLKGHDDAADRESSVSPPPMVIRMGQYQGCRTVDNSTTAGAASAYTPPATQAGSDENSGGTDGVASRQLPRHPEAEVAPPAVSRVSAVRRCSSGTLNFIRRLYGENPPRLMQLLRGGMSALEYAGVILNLALVSFPSLTADSCSHSEHRKNHLDAATTIFISGVAIAVVILWKGPRWMPLNALIRDKAIELTQNWVLWDFALQVLPQSSNTTVMNKIILALCPLPLAWPLVRSLRVRNLYVRSSVAPAEMVTRTQARVPRFVHSAAELVSGLYYAAFFFVNVFVPNVYAPQAVPPYRPYIGGAAVLAAVLSELSPTFHGGLRYGLNVVFYMALAVMPLLSLVYCLFPSDWTVTTIYAVSALGLFVSLLVSLGSWRDPFVRAIDAQMNVDAASLTRGVRQNCLTRWWSRRGSQATPLLGGQTRGNRGAGMTHQFGQCVAAFFQRCCGNDRQTGDDAPAALRSPVASSPAPLDQQPQL